MNFIKRLFGSKLPPTPAEPSPPAAAAAGTQSTPADSAQDPNMIRVFDAYGREMFITKETWRANVLPESLQKAWGNPDDLAQLITQSIRDEFYKDMVAPVERLAEIDPNYERSAILLGIVYIKVGRLADAERVFTAHLREHGESGVLLNNLAKVYSAKGENDRSLQTLWRGLELDPNQENGLGWYVAIFRDKAGEPAGLDALRRISVLPGSWRARLWLARDGLENRQLDEALRLYSEALTMAPRPVPADLLTQMSGDLGNHGHLPELLTLTVPHFAVATHGIAVGNNLIKANIDLGRLDAARALIDQHYALKRPDWQKTLSLWDNEVAKAQAAATPVDSIEKVSISLLNGEGPVWLPEKSPANELFPVPVGEPLWVAFLGSSAETPAMGDKMRTQLTDGPGRLSRALPLFLAEQVRFGAHASVRTLVPWLTAPHKGFVLCGVPWSDSAAADYARQNQPACDYVVVTHLKAVSEPWRVALHFVRTIDGTCLATADAMFLSTQPQAGLSALTTDLLKLLVEHAGAAYAPAPALYQIPTGGDFTDYLVRLEQLLAVRCGEIDGTAAEFLSGERDIILGNLQLCLNHPQNAVTRILLAQTCTAMKRVHPEIVAEYRDKLQLLQREHPLAEPAHGVVQRMLNEVFALSA